MLRKEAAVVIADDNQFEGGVLLRAVESHGLAAVLVQTSAQAQSALLEVLEVHERALFVLDFHLGPDQANDVVEELSESLLSRIQIVICSGSLLPKRLIDEERIDAVWEKPFDLEGFEELAQRIAQMAGMHTQSKVQSAETKNRSAGVRPPIKRPLWRF